jgi:hypothetical protein
MLQFVSRMLGGFSIVLLVAAVVASHGSQAKADTPPPGGVVEIPPPANCNACPGNCPVSVNPIVTSCGNHNCAGIPQNCTSCLCLVAYTDPVYVQDYCKCT